MTRKDFNKISAAKALVTLEMFKNISYGETVNLIDNYVLYHYSNDDMIVIAEDTEDDYEEIFCVQADYNTGELFFEIL